MCEPLLYLVNFGRSPALPVDVMLGRVDVDVNSDRTVPQYIKDDRKHLRVPMTQYVLI